jgi:hypothetical protein
MAEYVNAVSKTDFYKKSGPNARQMHADSYQI